MKQIQEYLKQAQEWNKNGKGSALATLIRSSGSSPLPLGAKMLISSNLDMLGSVSRGCVEGAVAEAAQEVISQQKLEQKHYGISDSLALSVGLTCGGEIDVLIEPLLGPYGMTEEFINQILPICEQRKPFIMITSLLGNRSGEKALHVDNKVILDRINFSDFQLSKIKELIKEQSTKTHIVEDEQTEILLESFSPPKRVIIIGAVHIAVALTIFAATLGYEVIIIDPRRSFATLERFHMADEILVKWPQHILHDLPIYESDHIVVISHDQKIDVPALDEVLKTNIRYIGLLGSQKTLQHRYDALQKLGWKPEDFDPIRKRPLD